jgi:hypothetical protein
MRRMFILALAVLAFVGFVAPPEVYAQAGAPAAAPAPTFAITGFIDNIATWVHNTSVNDLNVNRSRDTYAYARTRGRFDIIGQVGPAKAVFGFELDHTWGQTGFTDSNMTPGCGANNTGAVQCGAQLSGAESSFDLNTDTEGNIQVKWLYTEFPMPLVPFATIVRLGAQPFATAASYKLAVYANGDFPGVNLYTTFSPEFKLQLTYVAIDETLMGRGTSPLNPFTSASGGLQATQPSKCIAAQTGQTIACQPQTRGENLAVIVSPEITPFKGLDIKPMYSYIFLNGQTTTAVRQVRGGIPTATSITGQSPFAPSTAGVAGADGSGVGVHEHRHTIGVDARYRMGPWQFDPSVYYQFGKQQKYLIGGLNDGADAFGGGLCPGTGGPTPGFPTSAPPALVATAAVPCRRTASISAWLVDVRGGFQLGPLLLQSMVMWTSGQSAKISPYRSINYYQPLDTDTGYTSDWGTQIFSLGVDYFQSLNTGPTFVGNAIGYDKYGRIQFGAKASYAVTPALTLAVGVTPNWTDKKVDTDSIVITGGGLQPSFVCRKTLQSCRPEGDSNYLGTELNAALTYRFAPGISFDWAIGYLFSGNALAHRYVGSVYNAGAGLPVNRDIGVDDVVVTTARVRFSF